MNKLKKTYNEFITNKEKNKIKINERIEIMKENKRKKSYIFSFATIVTTVVMLIVGYYYFNNNSNDKVLKNTSKPNDLSVITIEGKTYYNYYNMGVSMEKVPTSKIYGYAIREDNESYKIVSLHRDGTNFDLVAIDEPIQKVSSDMRDLTEHYKLALVDNKLYFIRHAYDSSKTEGEDNSNVITGKNQKYDFEVYYIDITDEYPKLEVLLQVNDGPNILYNVNGVMINNGYLYYYNQFSESGIIEVLSLGNNPEKNNIQLEDRIFSYYISDDQFYVSYGKQWFDEENMSQVNQQYAIVDPNNQDDKGYNLYTTISEEEYDDKFDYENIWTSNNLIHYFKYYNRYKELWADNKQVLLQGFEAQEKGVGFVGTKILVDNEEIYKYDGSDVEGIKLLSVNGSIVNFCIGIAAICDDNEYYSYNVQTKDINSIEKTDYYFLITYGIK